MYLICIFNIFPVHRIYFQQSVNNSYFRIIGKKPITLLKMNKNQIGTFKYVSNFSEIASIDEEQKRISYYDMLQQLAAEYITLLSKITMQLLFRYPLSANFNQLIKKNWIKFVFHITFWHRIPPIIIESDWIARRV